MTTYLAFKQREFEESGSTYKVVDKDNEVHTKDFLILKNNIEIAHIYKVSPDDGFLASRYIIGYDDNAYENVVVLISLAMHLIMYVS